MRAGRAPRDDAQLTGVAREAYRPDCTDDGEVTTDVEVVFLVADLAGYTALTEAHGGTQAATTVRRYVEIAEAALRPGVTVAERVGDELLIVGAGAADVLETALRLRDAVEAEPMFPGVRMGIHGGRVVASDGRYYGTALNLAARLAAHAGSGQIMCSDTVAAVCKTRGIACRPLGPIRFKNLTVPIAVFEILAPAVDALAVDPVCRMHVSTTAPPARLPWSDRDYLFCSFECARTFAAAPGRYVVQPSDPPPPPQSV